MQLRLARLLVGSGLALLAISGIVRISWGAQASGQCDPPANPYSPNCCCNPGSEGANPPASTGTCISDGCQLGSTAACNLPPGGHFPPAVTDAKCSQGWPGDKCYSREPAHNVYHWYECVHDVCPEGGYECFWYQHTESNPTTLYFDCNSSSTQCQ